MGSERGRGARGVPPSRAAGQGAREKSNELAAKNPIKTFFSKLTFDIIPTEENAWRIGAESEEEVGELLATLPSKYWTSRHDVLLKPNWNVDHVVVGPPGVFAMDTKFRSGRVTSSRSGIRVNGYKTEMSCAVQDQAKEVSARLKAAVGFGVWVQPVLVFANEIGGRAEPDGVHVVGVDELVEYLRELPRELDGRILNQLREALNDHMTWRL